MCHAAWDGVVVSEEGDYVVLIRFPDKGVRQESGVSASITATNSAGPQRCVIVGRDGVMTPISVDLHVSLVFGAGVGKSLLPGSSSPDQAVATYMYIISPEPETAIRFQVGVERSGPARLSIYDVSGRIVEELFAGTMTRGERKFEWDGRSSQGAKVASGVYIAAFRVGGKVVSRKVVLAR